MNRNGKRDIIQIEEAYEAVVGTPPGKKAAKQATKAPKAINRTYERAGKKVKVKGSNTDIPAEKPDGYQGFVHDNSGPEGAANWAATQLDPDNPAIKLDNEFDVKQLSDPEASDYFKAENQKISKESINTNMAKTNKSIFDRLYEEVMDDETMDAVELGVDVDGGEDVDVDVDETEDITISIPRDVAKHLHDALMDVMDAADDIEDVEDELGDYDDEDEMGYDEDESEKEKRFGGNKGDRARRFDKKTGRKSEVRDYGTKDHPEEDEESFNYFGEEIEAEVLGTPLVNQKEGNPTPVSGSANVVKSQYTGRVDHGEGEAKIDYDGYTEDEEGTPLHNQKIGNPTSVKGAANAVKGVIKGGGKGDQEFFQKNKPARR